MQGYRGGEVSLLSPVQVPSPLPQAWPTVAQAVPIGTSQPVTPQPGREGLTQLSSEGGEQQTQNLCHGWGALAL